MAPIHSLTALRSGLQSVGLDTCYIKDKEDNGEHWGPPGNPKPHREYKPLLAGRTHLR